MEKQDDIASSRNADAALYERYAVSIFAYLRLHTTSWEDAEDILSEVFTAALEQDNLSWLADKQHFVWLRRVAQNKLVDRYRHSTRFPVLPLEQVVETVRIEEALSPEQVILRREELERLAIAVKQLPLLQQQILQLRLGDGLRFSEIAVLLNKHEEALRKIFSRALAALRSNVNYCRRESNDDKF